MAIQTAQKDQCDSVAVINPNKFLEKIIYITLGKKVKALAAKNEAKKSASDSKASLNGGLTKRSIMTKETRL